MVPIKHHISQYMFTEPKIRLQIQYNDTDTNIRFRCTYGVTDPIIRLHIPI